MRTAVRHSSFPSCSPRRVAAEDSIASWRHSTSERVRHVGRSRAVRRRVSCCDDRVWSVWSGLSVYRRSVHTLHAPNKLPFPSVRSRSVPLNAYLSLERRDNTLLPRADATATLNTPTDGITSLHSDYMQSASSKNQ